jgi:hypothetical protein
VSALQNKRVELRDALRAANFHAFSTKPEAVVPPVVFVTGAEPYVSLDGAAFGGAIVHHQVTVVGSPGINEETADELDELVEGVLAAIGNRVGQFEVGRPASISLSGQEHPAAAITTHTEIRLEDS